MIKEKQLYKFVVRDTSDNDNYVKDKNETIISFDTYLDASRFVEVADLQKTWKIETVNLSLLYELEVVDKSATNYGEQKLLNMYELLCDLNKDRSADWEDYDQTNFIDGISVFSEYKLVGVLLKRTDK